MKRLGQALIGAVAAARSIGVPTASAQPTTPSATPTSVVVGDDVRQHLVSEYQQRLRALTSPGRILGGTLAAATDFPWQVALVSSGYSPRDGQYCGGTLVAPTWVLTAAHCVSVGTQPSDLTVYAGSTSLAGGGTTVNVVQIFPHERFNAKTFDNDVALLLLDSPLDPTWSINLLSAGEETVSAAPGRKGRVSGWGLTAEGGSPSKDLRYVSAPFVDHTTCNAVQSYNGRVTDNMLCAGYADGGRDACQGDSGGPLVVPQSGSWRLAGVVSWGDGCGEPNKYGIYTRATRYGAWVTSHLTADPRFAAGRGRDEWMGHLDWAIGNTDAGMSTDCPARYPLPGCIAVGGRSCLMEHAIALAKAGDYDHALDTALVTQCHNPAAEASIRAAGKRAVGEYLRAK